MADRVALRDSPLVENLRFSNTTTRVMSTTKTYDKVNRLLSIASSSNAVVYSSNSYAYNLASQRTAATNELGNRWDYQYDTLGQLKQGWQYTNGNTLITGRDFDYVFDDIGNRRSTTNNSTATNYTANLLNQYTAVGAASPTYDLDGNLTNDGRFSYTWDGENRLIALQQSNQRLEFAYDYQGRRIQKKVYSGSPGSWTAVSTNRFVYDGWNLIAVLSGPSLTLSQYFYWGLDLSGSLQGAGGVGGLLCVKTAPLPHFATFDGNGNVTALVRCSDGYVNAKYEYGPFGELLRATGNANITNNPFRFSTKYQDNETGLLYYGYRYYDPGTGRWLSRDPMQEEGGVNMHGFIGNDPMNQWDLLGMASSLTDLLEQRMLYFYNNHADQVGSRHPSPPPNCTKTDCITYCYQVIEWAYQQMGQKSIADEVYKKRTKGTDLAKYLQSIGWKAVYWNPDVKNPSDGDNEHPYSHTVAKKKGTYYGIPITAMVINYRPTVIMDPPQLPGGQPTPSPKMTAKDATGLEKLKKVRFGYGLARGGMHTFLYGSGSIYEVHWTGLGTTPNGPNGLYEQSPFENYTWLSGAMLVPPDNGQY